MSYLQSKGHHPVKNLVGGRLTYLCPFSWHSETKPSFVVWTNSEFENFYCFGCQSKYHIIHLVSLYEGISYKEAVVALSDGIEVTAQDNFQAAFGDASAIFDDELSCYEAKTEEFSCSLLEISDILTKFLKSVKEDENEEKKVQQVYKMLDGLLFEYDIESVEKIRQLIESSVLQRRKKIQLIEQEKLKNEYLSKKSS